MWILLFIYLINLFIYCQHSYDKFATIHPGLLSTLIPLETLESVLTFPALKQNLFLCSASFSAWG